MKKCITTIFYLTDNFCQEYQKWEQNNLIPTNKKRNRSSILSLSELLTIVLYFYISPCQDFKNYYLYYLSSKYKGYFQLPSYVRVVQLWPRLILPLSLMMHMLKGEKTGIYFIDSTKLQICHNKRTSSNRVFGKIAKMGKSSYGWFMGVKLHIIINNKGAIMAIKITKGNNSDISAANSLAKDLNGTIYGDKGYISKKLFEQLFAEGVRLFTGIRKDMHNHLLPMSDKILMRKRVLIESVFNVLKNSMKLEHSRHRSPANFIVHVLACIHSYSLAKITNQRNFLAP